VCSDIEAGRYKKKKRRLVVQCYLSIIVAFQDVFIPQVAKGDAFDTAEFSQEFSRHSYVLRE